MGMPVGRAQPNAVFWASGTARPANANAAGLPTRPPNKLGNLIVTHTNLLTTLALGLSLLTPLAQAVMCASGIQPSNPDSHYAPSADGSTVTHIPTGLVWKRCAEGQTWTGATCTGSASTFSWAQALTQASTSSFADQSDWRLPNLKELRSLVEECTSSSINYSIFPNPPALNFWSSSPESGFPSHAWGVAFYRGVTGVGGESGGYTTGYPYAVRLVRAGQSFDSLASPNDTTPPTLSTVALSGIGQTALTLNATSNEAATGYWLAIPSGATAPTAAQVKSGVNYAGVTIAASGSGAMTANVATSFTVSGLTAGTSYDFYVVAMDSSGNLSAIPTKAQGNTIATAAAPVVTSFVFDPITSQASGVPVQIRIRAVNALNSTVTAFNDRVRLLGLNGTGVVPSQVKFTNGVFSSSVTYLGSGTAKITAQYSPSSGSPVGGESNQFSLSNATQRTYTVTGRTLAGTAVQLLSTGSGGTLGPVATDDSGVFTFLNVPTGEWRVLATPTQSGWVQVCPDGKCNITVTQNLTNTPTWLRTKRQPVILVPGMMGSTLKSGTTGDYANPLIPRNVAAQFVGFAPQLPLKKCLPNDTECPLRKVLEIYDPSQDTGGQCLGKECTVMGSHLLIDALQSAGFEVYAAPWDWRHPITEAASIYLKPVIDEAIQASGWPKVHVVAHSMGGLVTRHYIEKMGLGGTIDRFIMLGTPNEGSTNAYYLMLGSDPITLDRKTTDGLSRWAASAAFYTAAANELWRTVKEGNPDMVDMKNFSLENDQAPRVSLTATYKAGVTKLGIMNFIADNASGGFDLLPTYPMLKRWQRTWQNSDETDYVNSSNPVLPIPSLIEKADNPNLRALNQEFVFAKHYKAIDGHPSLTQVSVRMLLSNSEPTMLDVLGYSFLGRDSSFPFGEPNYTKETGTGDGTVLLSSGAGPFGKIENKSEIVCEGEFESHARMVGVARQKVVDTLLQTEVQTCDSVWARNSSDIAAEPVTAQVSIANVDVEGSYSALLTTDSGKRAGTAVGVDGIFEEIPDSNVSISPYQSQITQSSPADGTYSFQLTADNLLANTAVRVSLTYLKPQFGTQRETVRILAKAAPYSINLVQDSSATRWMAFVDPVKPPLSLRAMPFSDLTQLSWLAPNDSTVNGYNIYYRPLGDSRFVLLGRATTNSFTTSVPWAGTYDGSTEFIVLSTNSADVESPIREDNSARNLSYSRAAFTAVGVNANGVVDYTTYPSNVTFTDQSDATVAIQSWLWDFNNDGVVDSTEQNPTFSFPHVGSFSVSLTVTSNDGSTDTKTIQSFVNIRTGPGAPTIGTASSGNAQATVSFTAPLSDGNSAITAYTVTCSATGQTPQSVLGISSPLTVTGLTNGLSYSCSVTATNGVGIGTASESISVIPSAPGSRLLNIATRGQVQTVDNVMIAGFIIQGSSPKKVLIRARGPSLAVAPFNVPGTLSDPFLTLYSGATPIDTNDDFAQHANAAQIPADWTPANAKEAAIVTTLNPGAYTAIVNGVGSTSGVAIVEVFEIDQPGTPLINIATRGPVYTGDNVMIAGLIIQGDAPKTVLITARGPSMAGPPHNVPGTLSDPVLTLYSGQTPIASNDDWGGASNASQIQTAIGAPTNPKESAILITLQPGAYTAIVNGANNATGLGIVEVFAQ
jgi:PKD repeat protein